jgi:hypothetical protein
MLQLAELQFTGTVSRSQTSLVEELHTGNTCKNSQA